ncbi:MULTISPECIES: YggS family pyridoxal phosphate-dependent enzyme [unclassified Microbacterium]|uniref:YggS family pyridoxal phosphate-dependent enzyme n=1 Tax=unclassified Microbacterium TaxID=2609290 RepID=UPI002FCCDA21
MTDQPARPLYPQATSVAEFAQNIADVRANIAAAAERSGRDASGIRLLAVSKTVPEERLRLAIEAGATDLGENKVQEAKRKAENLADLDLRWSVIGHLQTNKAKDVVSFADEFQALDSIRLADALDKRLQAAGRSLDVFVQVNTSAEEQKSGIDPADALAFLEELKHRDSLHVQGLMTLALFTSDTERVRECFRILRDVRDRARERDLVGPGELSMGMSGDYQAAIEEGSTVVRVGQKIFGSRASIA